MTLLTANLQDVSMEGPPRMEIGVYEALESIKVTVNPPEGDKSSSLDVVFQDANREEGDERQCRKRFSFSSKALFYFKQWLAACERVDLATAAEIDSDDLTGLKCKAVLSETSDVKDGETRTFINIKRFLIPDAIKAKLKDLETQKT